MQQISQFTTSIKEITKAIEGKWDRTTRDGATWAINGNIVFLEGSTASFPFKVIRWHQVGSLNLAILGDPKEGFDPETKDLQWVIEQLESLGLRVDDLESRVEELEHKEEAKLDLVKTIPETGRARIVIQKF